MIVLSIDPGNTYTGWCVSWAHPLRETSEPTPGVWGAVRVGDRGVYTAARELRETIGAVLSRRETWTTTEAITHVYVEQAPIASRDDKLGNEADIGWKQGWAAAHMALIVAPYCVPIPVQVSAWRESMIIESTRAGFLLQAPSRKRAVPAALVVGRNAIANVKRIEGGRFEVEYKCGHHATAPNYSAMTERFVECPECAKPPRTEDLTAEEIRDAWKELACRFAAHWAPETYARLVADARSRARTEKPDHQLQGVPDACEALGINVHAYRLAETST